VRIDDEKMSKSLGNFFTIREVTEKYDPEVLRYFILTSHYRSPLNYSDKALDNAKSALTTLYTALRGVGVGSVDSTETEYHQRVRSAMDDDFNTAEVLPVLFDLAKEVNRYKEKDNEKAKHYASVLRELSGMIGLLNQEPEMFLRGGANEQGTSAEDIDALIKQRNDARAAKDWAESDRIRDVLKEQGIVLEDAGGETSWRRE
jgi:cysteinyl-tRNA synthetase